MWREYTRETPARPGLALIATAIAFLSTSGLAWYLTNAPVRHIGGVPTLRTVRPANFPIAFEVPDSYVHAGAWHADYDELLNDRPNGSIEFASTDVGLNRTLLRVRYLLLKEGATSADAFRALLGATPDSAEPARIGPFPALIATLNSDDGTKSLASVGCTEDGLAVSVEMVGLRFGAREKREFLAVCASVEFKNWTQPK